MADFNQFNINRKTPPFDIAKQQREGENFLGGLRQQLASRESLPAASSRIGNQLFVPQLREQALRLGELGSTLSSQIRSTPKTVAGTTRESLVTEPQRQMLVQAQQRPLFESLGSVERAAASTGARLTSAEQQLGQRLGLLQAEQKRNLLPFELGFSLLEQRQAREFTGYTFENRLELDRLIANQQAGITLSENEKNRANQLALAELDYKRALDSIKEQGSQARETKKAPTDLATLFNNIF